MKKSLLVKIITVLLSANSIVAYASELTIPNTFSAGTPAVAADVNANFNAAKNAVDDNNTQIGDINTVITDLTQRIVQLEADSHQGVTIKNERYYGTDMIFLNNDVNGTFIIPITDDQQSPSEVTETFYLYRAFPGLDQVSFNVDADDTTVIFSTTGEVFVGQFKAWAALDVTLRVDGVIPVLGAEERIRIVTDDDITSGSQHWKITLPMQLNQGAHTFSVMIKAHPQNQSSITIDGRSINGRPGRVSATVMQIKMP